MTTLDGRHAAALIVIDVQNDVVGGAYERDRVVATIAGLVDRARAAGVEVIWVQNHNDETPLGSEGWQLVRELTPLPAEPRVDKRWADAFEETELEQVLAGRAIGRLYVAGAQTDECIRSTLHGAVVRGYDAILISDAHTTEDTSAYGNPPPDLLIAHTNLYWKHHRAPGRIAGTVTSADVDFAAAR